MITIDIILILNIGECVIGLILQCYGRASDSLDSFVKYATGDV